MFTTMIIPAKTFMNTLKSSIYGFPAERKKHPGLDKGSRLLSQ